MANIVGPARNLLKAIKEAAANGNLQARRWLKINNQESTNGKQR